MERAAWTPDDLSSAFQNTLKNWRTNLVANGNVGVLSLARIQLTLILHRLETLSCALFRLLGDVGVVYGGLWTTIVSSCSQ